MGFLFVILKLVVIHFSIESMGYGSNVTKMYKINGYRLNESWLILFQTFSATEKERQVMRLHTLEFKDPLNVELQAGRKCACPFLSIKKWLQFGYGSPLRTQVFTPWLWVRLFPEVRAPVRGGPRKRS